MSAIGSLHLWPLRVGWVLVALVASMPISDALSGRSTPVVVVVTVLAWAAWTGALVAMLVPRTSSLTVVRTIVPASVVATVAAGGAEVDPIAVAAIALASATTLVALAPWTIDEFVDGSSYGPERRLALRTPLLLTATAVVTWAAVTAGAVAGPLLLASQQWALGAVALALGAGTVWAGGRALHQLARRWVVLVPTGMVVHDPITMPEAQLFLRQSMARLGPAEDADDAPDAVTEDLTAGASGLVVELALSEPVELLVLERGRGTTTRSVDRVRFTPSLPAVLLAEARDRRLPVG